jgi:hypothetical protein
VKFRPDLKVLYTTGYSAEVGGSGDPEVELLPKPYREDDLVRTLKRVFA